MATLYQSRFGSATKERMGWIFGIRPEYRDNPSIIRPDRAIGLVKTYLRLVS